MTLKYRLHILGWYNFEILVQTLLKIIIGPGVNSFGGSKDEGRDAYFHGKAPFPNSDTNWEGEWIFQVKFNDIEFNETGIKNRLLNSFNEEIKSIKRRREV
jgi:hypothetical protein